VRALLPSAQLLSSSLLPTALLPTALLPSSLLLCALLPSALLSSSLLPSLRSQGRRLRLRSSIGAACDCLLVVEAAIRPKTRGVLLRSTTSAR
jgi:hypothetical protein